MIASIAILLALSGTPQADAQPVAAARATTAAVAAQAQPAEHEQNVAQQTKAESKKEGLDFMEHILDSHEVDVPFTNKKIELPPAHSWQVGPIDMTPTRHVVYLLTAAFLAMVIVLGGAGLARRAERGRLAGKRHSALEAFILFLRDDVVMRNIEHGEKYAPFIITLFFFILFANLLGLLPGGASATANISVTATLALLTFVVVEISGMRALGRGYLSTIFYWNKDLSPPMRVAMFVIMTPVEMVGKITKPFALAIRLMANMTAGHIVLLAIISLIFVFKSFLIAPAPVLMAVAINFLELFVSFLQAYIFALLAAVFVGLIRNAHH
jgi:F-type H+-transporting ATPase subunit a